MEKKKKINERYKYIQSTRKVSDKKIIQKFQDGIMIPNQVANKQSSNLLNDILIKLSRMVRKKI